MPDLMIILVLCSPILILILPAFLAYPVMILEIFLGRRNLKPSQQKNILTNKKLQFIAMTILVISSLAIKKHYSLSVIEYSDFGFSTLEKGLFTISYLLRCVLGWIYFITGGKRIWSTMRGEDL